MKVQGPYESSVGLCKLLYTAVGLVVEYRKIWREFSITVSNIVVDPRQI